MSSHAADIQPHPELPLVSVCIPVYNGAAYIGAAIDSVLGQHYPRLELIVQDNASTDGTWGCLQQLAAVHPQLAIVRNAANVGMAPNWNLAVNRARGEYVMLLSADDMLEPLFLTRCLAEFARQPVDAVTTNHFLLAGGDKKCRELSVATGIHTYFSGLVLLKNPFSINFTLFRKETVERLRVRGNLFAVNMFCCDYDLWLRLAFSGMRLVYLEEPLGTYRVHAANLSLQVMRMHRQAALVVLRHRRALRAACAGAYRFTLLRFLYRIGSCLVRQGKFDRRQFRLLWGRLCSSRGAS